MIKLKQLLQVIRAARQPEKTYLGDLAVLKADALGASVNPEVAQQLEPVAGYHPSIDLDALLKLPQGTFGHEYARHMRNNRLQPFNISPAVETIAKRNVFALRYAVTHDMFHVLLGFDTSYAGEMGVLAFAVAQNYSRSQKIGYWIATVLYPTLAPRQFREIFASRHYGRALGQQAEFLLGYRFEDKWVKPSNQIRKELGISHFST
ncbi:MAG: Coq4 family protein [Microcoleaceae cyanobacterium]